MLRSFARELEKIGMKVKGISKPPSIDVSRNSSIFGSKSGASVPASQTVSTKPQVGPSTKSPVALSGLNAGRKSGAHPQATTVPQYDLPNTSTQ